MQADQTPLETALRLVGTQADVARLLVVSPSLVNQWLKRLRPIPPDHCAALEREVNGEVTVEQMRPDEQWTRVADPAWPHPDGRPCLDVAGKRQELEAPAEQGSA